MTFPGYLVKLYSYLEHLNQTQSVQSHSNYQIITLSQQRLYTTTSILEKKKNIFELQKTFSKQAAGFASPISNLRKRSKLNLQRPMKIYKNS